MKKTMSILSLGILMGISCSGQWGKKIEGNGNAITIKRSVENYVGLAVSGWFDVDLVDGPEGNLSLEGEENLLEYIITEVKNGSLNIRVKKGADLKPSNGNRGIRIIVPVENIENISMSGSGDIVGKTTFKASAFKTAMSGSGDITLHIMANTMTATMSGSGDMNLSGTVKDFEATVSGSGDIKAYDLAADNVQATISGSADIKVTAKEMLKARVSGSGDISYRGNPREVDTKTSGSGYISKG